MSNVKGRPIAGNPHKILRGMIAAQVNDWATETFSEGQDVEAMVLVYEAPGEVLDLQTGEHIVEQHAYVVRKGSPPYMRAVETDIIKRFYAAVRKMVIEAPGPVVL